MTEPAAEWIRDLFKEKFDEKSREIGRFNVAIFGKPGAGKTTLLNVIFGRDVAATGVGRPVTQDKQLYKHDDGHLGVLDTPGLEIGNDTKAIIADLEEYMDKTRHGALEDQIHVAWYCVMSMGRRFEDTEAEFIGALRRLGFPVLIVLTQVPKKDGQLHPAAEQLKAHIDERGLASHRAPAFMTNAVEDLFDDNHPVHGLQELLDATFRVAPEGVRTALTVAQQIDMARKQAEAHKAIAAAAALAGTAAAVPIPFADAVVLVPIQLAMMASVAITFGVKFDRAAAASVAATAAATVGGRALVANLLMFVPGIGSIAGGAISVAVATSFTWAMGQAWASVCDRLARGELQSVTGVLDNDAIREAFMAEFRSRINLKKHLPGPADQTPDH
jgi:small GTP-binding protein